MNPRISRCLLRHTQKWGIPLSSEDKLLVFGADTVAKAFRRETPQYANSSQAFAHAYPVILLRRTFAQKPSTAYALSDAPLLLRDRRGGNRLRQASRRRDCQGAASSSET